jgi:hypothetical protein
MGRQVKVAEHVIGLWSDNLLGPRSGAGRLATERVPARFDQGFERCRDDLIIDAFQSEVKDHGRGGSRTVTVVRLDALNPGGEEKAKLAGAL